MSETFDFIVVGGGSAGAVIAARLSEDPACRVALLEAGGRPPDVELMPVACAALQLNADTDWMYTADPGKAGLGLVGRRVPVPRGKMLGGTSGLNYMAYVRGHPGDFDAWAEGGASGWSYAEVLPYFRKSEGLAPSDEIVVDAPAHNRAGPMGVSVRSPVLQGAREFVEAAEAAGIPRGDYNGRDRGGAAGVVSLVQTSTRHGKRSSTYRAFLEGEAERRPNLTIITGAQATRVVLEDSTRSVQASGVEYRTGTGETRVAFARKEVILSAGAVGSPHLLLLSGIGPRGELERVGVPCLVDSPHVGKHLKDHIQVPMFFPAPGVGVSMNEVGISMGPAVLRQAGGPLPADPNDDEGHARRTSSSEAGSGAPARRVGNDRLRADRLLSVRRVRLVFDRPRRQPQSRRADRFRSLRVQRRSVARVPETWTRRSISTTHRRAWRPTRRA